MDPGTGGCQLGLVMRLLGQSPTIVACAISYMVVNSVIGRDSKFPARLGGPR